VLYLMMWSVALPPQTNPVLDDHILGALTLIVLAATFAGNTWGLGKVWSSLSLVRRYGVLK
jgi:thiosulfate dehydrogenase [quinone] large subunit